MERQAVVMTDKLSAMLTALETFGRQNDAQATSRAQKMLNITRDTGEFLLLLIRALRPKRVLEIGTSNGYSTLWLAHAVRPYAGKVTTLEHSLYKADMARANFARAEMTPWISSELIEAGDFLKHKVSDAFDFVFLDSNRQEYVGWWNDLHRVLVAGGLVVVDNAVSHAQEMEDFVRVVRQTPRFITSLVPLGHGELLILKEK